MTRRDPATVAVAAFLALLIPACGYVYLGGLVAALFLVGYVGGLLAWLKIPTRATWAMFRWPYWAALSSFLLLHKVEENRTEFFRVLGEKITGVPVPQVTFPLILGLLVLPLGAWILIPFLMRRGSALGHYLAWTFMASMGLTEAAHFIFPLLTGEPYAYFPGMWSAAVIVPIGWWGMVTLARKKTS